MRIAPLTVLAACLTLSPLFALAGTVYENGPINGQVDAWTINFGFEIDDSFFVATPNAQVSGISFGAWLTPGDVLQTVEVSITSQPGYGTTFFDGIVNFMQSGCFLNNYSFDVCTETGSFGPVSLAGGTYYLNLFNAVSADGDPVYWDENSAVGCHSEGCPSTAFPDFFETIPSEAFTVLGDSGSGTVPEPASLGLFASGVVGAGMLCRRKLLK
jgi:hypothetical protein